MNRTILDKLLQHSYDNYQVLFNQFKFHNHNAHQLGSLYLLGATDEQLDQVYKVVRDMYEPYDPSPYEITHANWKNFLGNKSFCKAYRDFFERELLSSGENWQKKFVVLLLDNKETPLMNGVTCGIAHSLIHIGFAFELDSRLVAIEALTMVAVDYDPLHEIVEKLKPPKSGSKSALDVFLDIHADKRLSIFQWSEDDNLASIAKKSADIRQLHYDQWTIHLNHLENSIEELFDLAVYIYCATHTPDKIEFDFLMLHLVSAMHAIRIIYSHLPNQEVATHILLQFFTFASIMYIANGRPKINTKLIDDYKVADDKNNWNYVIKRVLDAKLAVFRHLPKVIYFLKAAESVYGNKNGLYLKAAVKTIDNLNGEDAWVGFSDNPQYLISLKH